MPILHHGIDRVAGIGARARAAFRHEAAVGVGPRAMRRVAPLLAAEIHRAVARILRVAVVGSILPPQSALILLWIERDLDRQEALVAGVRAHQRAVGADVATDQARGHRLPDCRVEQLLQDARFVEATPSVLTERGGIPPTSARKSCSGG